MKNRALAQSRSVFNHNDIIIKVAFCTTTGSERFRYTILVLFFAFLLIQKSEVIAAQSCEPAVGEAVSVQGLVEFNRAGQPTWKAVTMGEAFCAGDNVRAASRSRAAILLANQTLIRLDENTAVTFSVIKPVDHSWLDLLKGAIHFLSRTRQSLMIKTPFVNAAIEGTEFLVRVSPKQTGLWVYEGVVAFGNTQGNLTLSNGEAAVAEAGKAPVRSIAVDPLDAVQWALYYPSVIDYQAAAQVTGPVRRTIESALADYRRNDLRAAFARLDKVPVSQRSTVFYILRAGLLLTVGRVDEAQPDIDQALELDAGNGTAYALRSIIALARNDTDKAFSLAEKGALLDPQSSVPQIALSYAHQARFNIKQARDSASKAVNLSPKDAMAWARLSELELSLNEVDKALAAARKAVSIDPGIARTQTVLGFAHLTEISIDDAKNAFQNAIELDQAAPLPRLGLGLATIRAGDLDEGVREIEIAASLDPDNSLIRSYLGKGYYEQKREQLAATEFEIAKQLDPKDPTPYFYDAILKQTTNRPVEALHEIQKAIELNDNRAVYRSRLLLDEDLAARSASLGRIYNDLGFQQLGLLEGWKSVNIDPGNYSAHRLLADNYAALPRHEIARVSELLQSQLLQPINITPVQPNLAESNMLILDGSGPSNASFNEFNPLFTRNRLTLQASGVLGSNDTLGDEVTQSGVWNNFSYSLGQFHFETDGFRENNDIDVDIYNAFVQASISRKLNLQAEFRHRDTDTGNLQSRFSPTEFNLRRQRNFRAKSDSDTYRFGLRVSPMKRSELLASIIYIEENAVLRTLPRPASFITIEGYLSEMQYLYRWKILNALLGGGYYRLDQDRELLSTRSSRRTEHRNAYLYSQIQFPSSVSWTFGLSVDDYELDTEIFTIKRDRVHPKIGMLWNITDDLLFRAAFFKTLKRSLVANQTLEPTQVTGFNQFFDDLNGTATKRWGIGIDHVLSPVLTGGIEISERDLNIPFESPLDIETNWKETLYRAYLQFTPYPRWAAVLEYSNENFDNLDTRSPLDTKTKIIPLSVSYFDPSGLFAKIRASYFDQEVALTTGTESDSVTFLDLHLGYRLPERLGIIEVQLQNVFDQNYRYEGLQDRKAPVQTGIPFFLPFTPEFVVFARLTLAF